MAAQLRQPEHPVPYEANRTLLDHGLATLVRGVYALAKIQPTVPPEPAATRTEADEMAMPLSTSEPRGLARPDRTAH